MSDTVSQSTCLGAESWKGRQVVGEEKTYENEQQARADGHGSDDGDDPVRLRLGAPPVPEEPGGDQRAPEHHDGEPVLGLALTAFGGHLCDLAIVGVADHDRRGDHADAHAEISQSNGAGGEAVLRFEDQREGREEEVDVRVDESHVAGETENNGGQEEHFRWSGNGSKEQNPSRQVDLQHALVRFLSGLLLHFPGFVS